MCRCGTGENFRQLGNYISAGEHRKCLGFRQFDTRKGRASVADRGLEIDIAVKDDSPFRRCHGFEACRSA
jgi:hypothetical protein